MDQTETETAVKLQNELKRETKTELQIELETKLRRELRKGIGPEKHQKIRGGSEQRRRKKEIEKKLQKEGTEQKLWKEKTEQKLRIKVGARRVELLKRSVPGVPTVTQVCNNNKLPFSLLLNFYIFENTKLISKK